MDNTKLSQVQVDAIDLLLAAAAWIAGEREDKPATNDCDAVNLVVDALSKCGVK